MTNGNIREIVKQKIHEIADEVDWLHLTIAQRKQYYEFWTADPLIGGRLSEVMDASRVRVYLKDTVMKTYSRSQRPEILDVLKNLGFDCDNATQYFIKPQGLLCYSTNLYTLATAKEWKIAIMSAFERAQEARNIRSNIVLITEYTTGRFVDESYRKMISDAATRLDIKAQWID